MKNNEIKIAIKEARLFQWQIAEIMGITECSFSRKMRHELSEEEIKLIFEAIEDLKEAQLI